MKITIQIFNGKIQVLEPDPSMKDKNEIEQLLIIRDAMDKTLFNYEKDYIKKHGTKRATSDLEVPTDINKYHKKPTE